MWNNLNVVSQYFEGGSDENQAEPLLADGVSAPRKFE
jgi:hypothetical protein